MRLLTKFLAWPIFLLSVIQQSKQGSLDAEILPLQAEQMILTQPTNTQHFARSTQMHLCQQHKLS